MWTNEEGGPNNLINRPLGLAAERSGEIPQVSLFTLRANLRFWDGSPWFRVRDRVRVT